MEKIFARQRAGLKVQTFWRRKLRKWAFSKLSLMRSQGALSPLKWSRTFATKFSKNTEAIDLPRYSLVSEGGQGTLEYMLLLVVIVLIGLGAIYQFNTAFGSYAQTYFVDYLACLLETGELPALGGASVTSGECDAEFQPFSLSNGRPLIESSGGSGANSGSNNGSARRNSFRGGSPSSFSRGGGGSPNAESGSGGSSPAVQSVSTNKSPKNRRAGESYQDGGSGGGGGGQRVVRSRNNIPGVFLRVRGAKEREARRSVAVNKKALEIRSLRKGVMKQVIQKKKGSVQTEVETKWGISKFIRLMLIMGIIMAIIIFLGSQVMQLRKNWEKPE